MSNKKTKREKKISDVIKLDPTAKTPTKAEFDRQAKNNSDINKGTTITTNIFGKDYTTTLYDFFYLNNRKSTEDYEHIEAYMDATEKFFELDFSERDNKSKKLLYEISDEAYYTGDRIIGKNEEGAPIYELIGGLYEEWKDYCTFVDNVKEYVSINFPNYDHNQQKYLDQIKKSAKLYPETILEDLYIYLNNYGLNQHKKAKADYLAQVGLPNINATNAYKIVELLYQSSKEP